MTLGDGSFLTLEWNFNHEMFLRDQDSLEYKFCINQHILC